MTRKIDSDQPYPVLVTKHLISALCRYSCRAVAQEAAQDPEEQLMLEEVLVTATKRGDINLQDVPMSITAFTDCRHYTAGLQETR